MEWYLGPWKKFAVFQGRASRKEFWVFYLVNIGISFLIGMIDGILSTASQGVSSVTGFGAFYTIFQLAILIPTIAVGVRRMHDTDHSGWWLLFPLVNLIFLLTDSQTGQNKYGSNPKGEDSTPFSAAA